MDYKLVSGNIGSNMVLIAYLWACTDPKNLFSGDNNFFINGNKNTTTTIIYIDR